MRWFLFLVLLFPGFALAGSGGMFPVPMVYQGGGATGPAADYYWPLDDDAASTTVLADAGGTNATLVNANTEDVQNGSGFDTSLGSNVYVSAGIPSATFTDGDFTLQMTINQTGTKDAYARLIAETSGTNMFFIVYRDSGEVNPYVDGANEGLHDISARSIEDGNDHVIRVVFDSPNLTFYEGSTEAGLTQAFTTTASTPTSWGGATLFSGGASNYWNGFVKDIKVWDDAVTP